MKIQGPGDAPPASIVGETEATKALSATPTVQELSGPQAPSTVQALAADLRAGQISAAEVVGRLAEQAAERISAVASPKVAERLKEMLLEVAESDPLLSAKLRALTDRLP